MGSDWIGETAEFSYTHPYYPPISCAIETCAPVSRYYSWKGWFLEKGGWITGVQILQEATGLNNLEELCPRQPVTCHI